MTKKKGNRHQPKDPKPQSVSLKNHEARLAPSVETCTEDPIRKLEDMKAINTQLLTEMAEKNLKIELLLGCKVGLVAELDRSDMEKHFLDFELSNVEEDYLVLGLQMDFSMVFIQTQFRELGFTIDRFVDEKLEIQVEIEKLKSQFAEFMSDKTNSFHKMMFSMEEKIGKLKIENMELVEENKIRKNVTEGLRNDIMEISKEKKQITMEKNSQADEFEKEISFWREIVFNTKNEENRFRAKISDLEKLCADAMDKEKKMNVLIEENESMEKKITELIEENHRLVVELSRVNNLIEENHRLIDELRDGLEKSQDTCNDHNEENKRLRLEIDGGKASLDRANKEKNDIFKCFEKERKKLVSLTTKASESETKNEELQQKLVKIEREYSISILNEKEKDSLYESLKKENEILESDLGESKMRIDSLEANLLRDEVSSRRALSMLMNTAKLVSKSESDDEELEDDESEDSGDGEGEIGDGVHKRFAVELNAIEEAFGDQEKVIGRMKFWIILLLSTMAVIFAAVALAVGFDDETQVMD